MSRPKVLLVGTGDTKSDELLFMRERIVEAGGEAVMMDVSVLGEPRCVPDYANHDVAAAASTTIDAIAASEDENSAMALMASGASALARRLHDEGKADALLVLGGSMGTDLALDVATALPLGVPKLIVSTIAFSHLIPPDRIAADLMMMLWAGGLQGLNRISQSALSQACGAIVGAARARGHSTATRPLIGMTSLGATCLRYMVKLIPALEQRGYEVAVFHTTGMGGRGFESLASRNEFVAVMDFALQEIVNHQNGILASSSGWDRLENAGRAGIPQIVAPGAIDMVDLPSWLPLPPRFAGRPYHAHNRLIGSVTTDPAGRRETARAIAHKLGRAKGPVAFILPTGGIEEWDQAGQPLHDPEGLRAFVEEMRLGIEPPVELHEVPDHINSDAFAAKALAVFDAWVAAGIVPAGKVSADV